MKKRGFFSDVISFISSVIQLSLLVYLPTVSAVAALAYYATLATIVGWASYTIYPLLFQGRNVELSEEENRKVRIGSSIFCGIVWPIYPGLCILHLLGLVRLPNRDV
jgi:hypothetical protein